MTTNWPIRSTVGEMTVEFFKPSNFDLSRVNRHFLTVADKMSRLSEEEAAAAMLNAVTYEEDRELLFKTISVEGVGFIDSRAKLEKLLEQFGLMVEIPLFLEAFKNYLGEAYRRVSVPASTEEKAATPPAASTPVKKLSGSVGVPSSDRLPRGAK